MPHLLSLASRLVKGVLLLVDGYAYSKARLSRQQDGEYHLSVRLEASLSVTGVVTALVKLL